MDMKVALVVPPLDNIVKYFHRWHLNPSDYGSFPPLGLLYIGTLLKKKMPDVKIKILDCPSTKIVYAKLQNMLKSFKPDVVGIYVTTDCLVDVLRVARLVKSININIHICAGGPHLFVYPYQTLKYPEIDSIVIGEGEYVFLELIKQIQDGKIIGKIDGLYVKSDLKKQDFKKAAAVDLDELPFFDTGFIQKEFYYSTVGRQRNVVTLLSSRGCPYSCTFCDVPYKVFRGRKIKNVLDEIKLRLNQGFKEIFFYDDTFNINPQRVIELSEEIIKEKLRFDWSFRGRVNTATFEMLKIAKRAGCQRIHFGIETATNEGLKELKKGITVEQVKDALSWCRRLKIKTVGDFIIGLPFEKSRKDVMDNIKRLMSFPVNYAQFNFLQPIPGTEIYESGIRQGVIDPNKWDAFVKFPNGDFEPPLWTQYLSKEEVADLFYFAYRRFYIRPAHILRNLLRVTTIHEFKRVLKGGVKILLKN